MPVPVKEVRSDFQVRPQAYDPEPGASCRMSESSFDLQTPLLLSEVQCQKALLFSPEQVPEKTSRYALLFQNENALSGYPLHKSCKSRAEHLLLPSRVHLYWPE